MLEEKASIRMCNFTHTHTHTNPHPKVHSDMIFLRQENTLLNSDGLAYCYEMNFTSFG